MAKSPTRRLEAYTQVSINRVILCFGFIFFNVMYYTGHTDNLENRLAQHQNKMISSCYTSTRLPVKLMYSQEFPTREEALASEKQIQGWSRRKKEALMNGDWHALSAYASRRRVDLPAKPHHLWRPSSARTGSRKTLNTVQTLDDLALRETPLYTGQSKSIGLFAKYQTHH